MSFFYTSNLNQYICIDKGMRWVVHITLSVRLYVRPYVMAVVSLSANRFSTHFYCFVCREGAYKEMKRRAISHIQRLSKTLDLLDKELLLTLAYVYFFLVEIEPVSLPPPASWPSLFWPANLSQIMDDPQKSIDQGNCQEQVLRQEHKVPPFYEIMTDRQNKRPTEGHDGHRKVTLPINFIL